MTNAYAPHSGGVRPTIEALGPDRLEVPDRFTVRRLGPWAAAPFGTVGATTVFAADEFHRIGVPTTHIPLGVDLDRFRPRYRTRLGGRGRWQLVLCSRPSPEKRPDLAVQVRDRLRRTGVDASRVVAGDGPAMSSLRLQAGGLPVTFLGHVSERNAVADAVRTVLAVPEAQRRRSGRRRVEAGVPA